MGAEVGSQTVRQWCERNRENEGKLVFVADFENAFNTIDREKFLREVHHHLPGLAKWAEWCYGRSSKLFFDGAVVSSEVGVQQSDPLGPLLFALALQPVLQRLSTVPGLDLSFSYLDDLVLAGDQEAVSSAVALLKDSAATLGLKLNMSKCELVPAAPGGYALVWGDHSDLGTLSLTLAFNRYLGTLEHVSALQCNSIRFPGARVCRVWTPRRCGCVQHRFVLKTERW